jgi:uncharacterized membrane protein YtjA (UPF0391 family)
MGRRQARAAEALISNARARPRGHAIRNVARQEETTMLRWALIFLVVGLIAALLGFTGIAGASFAIAKTLAYVFLLVFVVLLLLGIIGGSKLTTP